MSIGPDEADGGCVALSLAAQLGKAQPWWDRRPGALLLVADVVGDQVGRSGQCPVAARGEVGRAQDHHPGLTRHAAIELGPLGIRVNCVCPTGVGTPLAGGGHDHWAFRSQALAHQHTDRLATVDDVAAAIHFLASDDAAMVNGHALCVDGGLGAGLSIGMIEAALGEPIRHGPAIIE